MKDCWKVAKGLCVRKKVYPANSVITYGCMETFGEQNNELLTRPKAEINQKAKEGLPAPTGQTC